MQKLAKRTLNKHVERSFRVNPLKTHHYAVEFPDRLIGKIIGKKGEGLKRLVKDVVHHKGQFYIDSNGKFFRWVKKQSCSVISHKIIKTEKRDIATLVWCKDIPYPFIKKRPPSALMKYANILYMDLSSEIGL